RVEARGAGSAVIRHALVEGQRRGREHEAYEEVGAERRREEVGVLADPAEPRPRREIALEHGSGIACGWARDGAAGRLADERTQLQQARADHVVIVAAARVPRDGPPVVTLGGRIAGGCVPGASAGGCAGGRPS